jgi:hypothetical protein
MAAEPHSVRHESIRKVYGRLNNVPKVDEKEFLTEDEWHEFKISEDWTKRIITGESVLFGQMNAIYGRYKTILNKRNKMSWEKLETDCPTLVP